MGAAAGVIAIGGVFGRCVHDIKYYVGSIDFIVGKSNTQMVNYN